MFAVRRLQLQFNKMKSQRTPDLGKKWNLDVSNAGNSEIKLTSEHFLLNCILVKGVPTFFSPPTWLWIKMLCVTFSITLNSQCQHI
jgi:hypothetical protein